MAGFYENSGDPSNIFTPTAKEEADRAAQEADRAEAAADNLANQEGNAAASALAAQASADNAAASEASAANFVTSASDYNTYAEEWSSKPEDTLVSAAAGGNQVDEYSSLHHAAKASASATSSANNASAAATSESNAVTSASNAAASEANASTSETNAAASETNANAAASSAASSADAAAIDAVTAAEAAQEAQNSANSIDVQTSPTDTTAGRLMAVGAFGLGSTLVPVEPSLNAIERTGFYRYDAATADAPTDAGGSLLHINRNGTIAAAQQAFDQTTGRVYTRILKGSVWQPWAEVRDSVNTSNPNLLVNGAFQVYQEADTVTNPTSGNEYATADMMRCRRSGNAGGFFVGKTSSGLEAGMEHAYIIARDVGDTNLDSFLFTTQMETKNVIPLQGKTVTLSIRLFVGATFSATAMPVKINTGTGIDEHAQIGNGTFATGNVLLSDELIPLDVKAQYITYVKTVTVPANAKELSVAFRWNPVGTALATDDLRLNYIKLEEGSVATPIVRPNYGEELAKCQRYRFITTDTYQVLTRSSDGTSRALTIQYPSEMRDTPAITVTTNVGTPVIVGGTNKTAFRLVVTGVLATDAVTTTSIRVESLL